MSEEEEPRTKENGEGGGGELEIREKASYLKS